MRVVFDSVVSTVRYARVCTRYREAVTVYSKMLLKHRTRVTSNWISVASE